MNRYSHSKGYASYQDALDSMETMIKNGDLKPVQHPKIVPYRWDKQTYKFSIDVVRT